MLERDRMDVAAIKGFQPSDPDFHERFRTIPVRPNVFGIVVLTGRPYVSNDVETDPLHVGRPSGHPGVRTFDRLAGFTHVPNRTGSRMPRNASIM